MYNISAEHQKLADRMIDLNKQEVENLVNEVFEAINHNANIDHVDMAIKAVAASRGTTPRTIVSQVLEFATLWESANRGGLGFSSAPDWLIAILSDESFGWRFEADGRAKSGMLHNQTRAQAASNFTLED
jgi:hypothetical protein